LFNILPHDFSGMKTLDLFAGSGNVTIEALSRGAAEAVLVEASARSAKAIRENLHRLGLSERAQLWVAPAARTLRSLAKRGAVFDVIFLDPPYEKGLREELSARYGALVLNDQRHYGDTRLSFFKLEAQTDLSA
jgi:16S rRNA (guanine(966)-N(2))-methyltransferase RsmD